MNQVEADEVLKQIKEIKEAIEVIQKEIQLIHQKIESMGVTPAADDQLEINDLEDYI
jgi:hypothetical protein